MISHVSPEEHYRYILVDRSQMMPSVFFPLRSNTAWFTNETSLFALEASIKAAIVLYDELLFQSGWYSLTVGTDGMGMAVFMPENHVPQECNDIEFAQTSGQFGVQMGDVTLLRSNAEISFRVGFRPLLRRLGILDAPFIHWFSQELQEPFRSNAILSGEHLARNDSLANDLPKNKYWRKSICSALYLDGVAAHVLQMPMSIDSNAKKLVESVNRVRLQQLRQSFPNLFFQEWVELGLPDFSALDWDAVLKIRDSDAGAEFRKMIQSFQIGINTIARQCASEDDIRAEIRKLLVQELVDEIASRMTTKGNLIFNILCNLTPVGAIVSGANDVKNYLGDSQSWITLLKHNTQ